MKKKIIFIPAPNYFGNTPIYIYSRATFTIGEVKPKSFRKVKKEKGDTSEVLNQG